MSSKYRILGGGGAIATFAILSLLTSTKSCLAQGWNAPSYFPNSGTVQPYSVPELWEGGMYGGIFGVEPQAGWESMSLSGSVGPVIFTWGQSGTTTPPPLSQQKYLPVLVTACVTGWDGEFGDQSRPSFVVLDDGFGDTITDAVGYSFGVKSAGSHLVQAPVTNNNGVWTATVPADSLEGSGTANNEPVAISATYMVVDDTRMVSLSRQGATGETTDPSSTVHGDTIFSSNSTTTTETPYGTITSTSSSMNWQIYLPAYIGNWGWITGESHSGNSEDVPNATFSWSPNESQDIWDWGTVEAPFGNISYLNGEPTGTPDKPTSKTVSYTATSNVDGAVATANYNITYHDPFEEVSHTQTNVTATGPLYGSDPLTTDNTLDIVWGYQPAGSQAVSKGTSSSQGIDIEGGLDASWLDVLGLSFDATKTSESGSDSSATVTLQINLPAGEYTYPEFVDTYVRNTVLYRQWGASGEITVTSAGSDAPATEVFDQYAGSSIFWHEPVPSTQPPPVQDPSPIPVVATPAAGS